LVKEIKYCTPDDVRLFSGLEEDDAPDSMLERCIREAEIQVIRDVTIWKDDVLLKGDIDGSNTNFYVINYPIADMDADKVIDENDVVVHQWTNGDDKDDKSEVAVSSVVSDEGRIVLTSAPDDTTVDKLTVDYRYYLKPVDWDLIERATALYAGYIATKKVYQLKPKKIKIGSLQIEYGDPWKRDILVDYKHTIRTINGGIVKVTQKRERWETFSEIEASKTDVKLMNEYQTGER
jgi:hypothetical protein